MTQYLDGKAASDRIKLEIAEKVKAIVASGGKQPHLAAILVGNDGASQTYVGHKERACAQVGFKSTLLQFEETVSEEELVKAIMDINNNDDIDGLIVQLPLPKHIDENAIIEAIDPKKDVDGFHPQNVGKMMLGLNTFLPATPYGIIKLLEEYDIKTAGKHCVILGRSNIVGRPMANILSRRDKYGDCTVTMCHSKTPDISYYTKQADIIVAAIGQPEFLKADMVKDGVIIIDVGITRIADSSRKTGYRLTGDVDFESVAPKSSYITPVPGGVGPMTIVSLLYNTIDAAALKNK
ncbi:MAG: tetrahydrofolate dehydrogenase/cyclohydrolase catalytic domain-containing protein [Bacteroidales bacterium]